jgi:membrane-associated phospholipid phosphatase
LTASLILFLSLTAFLINVIFYHYPGNNYFPPDTPYIAAILLIIYIGFSIQVGSTSQPTKIAKEIIILFVLMSILAILTNAVQYTPFYPIDHKIILFEQSLHINLNAIIAWTNGYPAIKKGLVVIYDSLTMQLTYIPLLIIITNQKQKIREFYFLMLVSALIGFIFYYFFPTTAPASVVESSFFSEAQKATSLKFFQLHQHISPSTLDGGLIAFPSFHVIWAWLCLYLLRDWPILFFPVGLLNLTLLLSCVLLGWHYPMDIFGGLLVVGIAHSLYFILVKKRQTKDIINYSIPSQTGLYNFC